MTGGWAVLHFVGSEPTTTDGGPGFPACLRRGHASPGPECAPIGRPGAAAGGAAPCGSAREVGSLVCRGPRSPCVGIADRVEVVREAVGLSPTRAGGSASPKHEPSSVPGGACAA